MPYIKKESRPKYDSMIQCIVTMLHDGQLGRKYLPDRGVMNYVITKIILGSLPPDYQYYELSAVKGMLHDVIDEFQHRVVRPYEDRKKKEHGDVY